MLTHHVSDVAATTLQNCSGGRACRDGYAVRPDSDLMICEERREEDRYKGGYLSILIYIKENRTGETHCNYSSSH
ncbi:hypothetical protein RchiOBHm_Chr6g0259751 [Rosa chinensis]|uniref:Uncharacterized protein n=1 Tax=Rosa chinensis TaxID=74649 RepID=A0A2P6PN03_ROSCH|nr:hypothetical protein RchiOBHm_Chr6g0259751 [Rosa chinensis]